MSSPRVLLQIASEEGHRGSYLSLMTRLLGGERATSVYRMLMAPQPVLFLTLEGSFTLYCFVGLFRALFGRRTVGLLLRPGPVLDGNSLRLWLKRSALKVLWLLPGVQTLTILPFSIEPRFSEIADGWIYDPQLWDLDDAERRHVADVQGTLAADIRSAAAGRRVVVAAGRQDKSKGFDWFSDIYVKHPDLRRSMLFAFGGKVSEDVASHLPAFEGTGGYACNRFITNEELLDLYASADLVWAAYDPTYDQASGILGRSAQLGIPAVVRRGSLMQRLCEVEGIAHMAMDEATDWLEFALAPGRKSTEEAAACSRRMRGQSLRRLRDALGITP